MSERLLPQITKDIKNFNKNDEKKIRTLLGFKTITSIIKYATESGVNIGKRKDTQKRRALDYARKLYNQAVDIINEKIIEERKERAKIRRVKKKNYIGCF
jgi:hypothetical protein